MRHANVSFFVPHLGCPHRCSFCDQRAISGKSAPPTPEEVTSVCDKALTRLSGFLDRSEIAFFGGSFTAIEEGYRRSLLKAASAFVSEGGFSGIRLSTRPDAINDEILSELEGFGVTAVELGAQSMDDGVLAANRRGHSSEDLVTAAKAVKARGFSLGVQMMTGLYTDTPERSLESAKKLIALGPDTARIYPAVTLRGTELERLFYSGDYRPPSLCEAEELSARLMLMFCEAGVSVIRVGLHASRELSKSYVAGPYHPAFRELCEGRIMLGRILPQLEGREKGPVSIAVCPRDLSRMIGQNRANIKALRALGYEAKVVAREGTPPFSPVVV